MRSILVEKLIARAYPCVREDDVNRVRWGTGESDFEEVELGGKGQDVAVLKEKISIVPETILVLHTSNATLSSPSSATSLWPFSSEISPNVTNAPARTNARMHASPIPLAPPVMMTLLP